MCRRSIIARRARRSGFVMLYAPFMLIAMFCFASLAVDWGRVQLTKTELERAADAAARAGLAELPNGVTAAETAIVNFAASNSADASDVVIDPNQDIAFGTWDTTAKSFTQLYGAARSTANAVRVTAVRSAGRGNAVPLVFGQVIGRSDIDVQATSTVYLSLTNLDYSGGFATASGLSYSGSAAINGSSLRITAAVSNQAGAFYFANKVPIKTFTTSFNFTQASPLADGFTFCIQNNTATSRSGAGGGLGYSGVANSIAVKFDIYSNAGEGTSSTGLYLNGASPSNVGSTTTGTVNLRSAHPMSCTLTYDGVTLNQTITDLTTNAVYTRSYVVDIPGTVGSSIAWVGFTGSTGGSSSDQSIQSWTYVTPGTVSLAK